MDCDRGGKWLEVRGGSVGGETREIVEPLQGRCSRGSANGGWRGWRRRWRWRWWCGDLAAAAVAAA